MKAIYPSLKEDLERAERELSNFKPRYSNDYKLEAIIKDMLENLHTKFKDSFKNIFVVSTWNRNFRAYIEKHRGEFDGEIVFVDLGMSNSIIDYSLLLAIFMAIKTEQRSPEELTLLKNHLKQIAEDIALGQRRWSMAGKNDTNLNLFLDFVNVPHKVRDMGAILSQSAHAFVIGHEIGHSLLEHTVWKDRYHEFVPVVFSDVMESSHLHQREFHADIFSMLLVAGALKRDKLVLEDIKFNLDAAFGSLLALTIFGQQSDPFKDSDTHPPVTHRYGICTNLLKFFTLTKPEIYRFVYGCMKDLQLILYTTQGTGLGQYYNKNNYILPWDE